MDELFTRYMYYERDKNENKNTTTEALRKFYEKDGYSLLKKDETLTNLEALASFWVNVAEQDDSVFSEKVLKNLSVLNLCPNGMWAYLTSVYFMQIKTAMECLRTNHLVSSLIKLLPLFGLMQL